MRKPRTTFATPFVVVLGCGHPADRPPVAPDEPDVEPPPFVLVRPDAMPLAPLALAPDAALPPCSAGTIVCEGEGCQFVLRDGGKDPTFTSRVTNVKTEYPPDFEIAIPKDFMPDNASGFGRGVFLDREGQPMKNTEFPVRLTPTGVLGTLEHECVLPSNRVQVTLFDLPGKLPDVPGPLDHKCRPVGKVICNPPRPPTGNPPAPMKQRIVKYEQQGTSLILTVPVGSDEGVANGWHVQLIDDADRALAGTEAVIIRVSKRQTLIRATITPDQAARSRVRLSAP
jgi:hypothetical protein